MIRPFRTSALLVAAIAIFASQANASLLTPSSITSQGTFTNADSLLIDGVFAAEFGFWQDPTNAWWNNQEGSGTSAVIFTIDYGSTFSIEDVVLSVDNNDSYRVDYSTDAVSWSQLFEIGVGDGEITNGMDTFSTMSGNAEYVANIDFSAVEAQYLRIYATGGDTRYSISEFEAYGSNLTGAVPEPASIAMWGALGLAGVLVQRRFRKRVS